MAICGIVTLQVFDLYTRGEKLYFQSCLFVKNAKYLSISGRQSLALNNNKDEKIIHFMTTSYHLKTVVSRYDMILVPD